MAISRTKRIGAKFTLLLAAILSAALSASAREVEIEHPLIRAIKSRDDARVAFLLRQGTPVNVSTADGTTPLMIAAAHGTVDTCRMLLDHGADPNAANAVGQTPLLWSVTDLKKVKLLLDHGVEVNTRTLFSQTPLIAAASYPTGADVVRTLLEHDAQLVPLNGEDRNVLLQALKHGNPETVKILLAHAEKTGQTAALIGEGTTRLFAAASEWGDLENMRALHNAFSGRDGETPTIGPIAFVTALRSQQPEAALAALEMGVEPGPLTGQFARAEPSVLFAAYNDVENVGVLRELLKRGVDVTAKNDKGESALTWARRRGHTQLIKELIAAGVPEAPDETPPIPERDINLHAGNQQQLLTEAVTKSIALTQHSSDVFLRERACTSCHHNDIPAIAAGWARDRGITIDNSALDRLIHRQASPKERRRWVGVAYDLAGVVGTNPRALGLRLWEYSAIGYPPDDHTEAMVWYVAAIQQADGRWRQDDSRAPLTGTDFMATAVAIQALQLYPITARAEEFGQRIERAAQWLACNTPSTHQERVYQLLGLGWAGKSPEKLTPFVDELLALQREDGGWAQLPNLPSDAWATGPSLLALHLAGGLPTTHAAYQRGLRFLLNTQFPDGSWYVQARAFPIQDLFDSEFPHGRDQWISAPATAFAAMAMTLAINSQGATLPGKFGEELTNDAQLGGKSAPIANQATPDQPKVSFVNDIQPILERSCVTCHSGNRPKGNLDMTTRALTLNGGDSGRPGITPGDGAASLIILAATGSDDLAMPPKEKQDIFPPLTDDELNKLRRWIDSGAAWPDDIKLKRGGY